MSSSGFVLDASIALGWAFADESDPVGDRAQDLLVDAFAYVPSLWAAEMANGLAVALRRNRISRDAVDAFVADVALLDIRVETLAHPVAQLVDFAAASGLSAYDSAYLLLTLDRDLPLATADARMREVAMELGVQLV